MILGWELCSYAEWNIASHGTFISCDQNDSQAVYEHPLLGGAGFPEKPLAPNLSWGYVIAPDNAPFIKFSTADPNRRGALFEEGKGEKGKKGEKGGMNGEKGVKKGGS